MEKRYLVRGLLKRGSVAKQFTKTVSATSIRKAEKTVKDIVSAYCRDNYPEKDEVKCIINKKTVRC